MWAWKTTGILIKIFKKKDSHLRLPEFKPYNAGMQASLLGQR